MSLSIDLGRLGELVMDRLLDVERRSANVRDAAVSTDASAGTLTMEAEQAVPRTRDWRPWSMTFLLSEREGCLAVATADETRMLVSGWAMLVAGLSLDELAGVLVEAAVEKPPAVDALTSTRI